MNQKSPPLQESFRTSFTQTVLQHHRDCKVEHCRDAHADGAADAVDYFLCVVEALAEHLGSAEHRDKGVEVFLMDKCLQLQCLAVGEGRICSALDWI